MVPGVHPPVCSALYISKTKYYIPLVTKFVGEIGNIFKHYTSPSFLYGQ
jgi:hypothetical protein